MAAVTYPMGVSNLLRPLVGRGWTRSEHKGHKMATSAGLRRGLSGLLVAALTGLGLVATASAPSAADTSPPQGTPPTVSGDGLSTWQLNGVVWSQVVVGNTVYATGNFTKARPPGAAAGTNEVNANNIFAYDIATGARVTSFNHSLNGQGLHISASPDGSRVYVVGDFTTVDGASRGHVAAFATGNNSLVTSFAPNVSAKVAAVTATNSTVYFGGNFFKVNDQGRTRLAAVRASDGANLSWAPKADDNQVVSMIVAPGGSRVVIGGKFTTLNGVSSHGMGAVDATTGATLPWAATAKIDNSGNGASITSLSTDGTNVYGTGYAFETGNFEGSFAADPRTGNLIFANDCHGDTYDAAPIGSVLYTVSHAHDCRWIGAFPESSQRYVNMRHALAFTTYPTTTNTGPDSYGWDYRGVGASSLLQWFPELSLGRFTGQNQAAWSVAGNSDYVVLGGEFPAVNGTAQSGLVRFAVKSKAPNKEGPTKAPGAAAPTAQSLSAGTARVAWQSAYDLDNASLTYNVYRSGTTAPVYTTTGDSNYWTYPMRGFRDTGLTPGAKYTYTVRVSDPDGNLLNLGSTSAVTVSSASTSAYSNDVTSDGATAFWRLGEGSGSTVYDYAGFNDATASDGVSRGAAGAIGGDSDTASSFNGSGNGLVVSPSMETTPSFSVEAWVKTTSNQGGKIVGYGGSISGDSGSYDRHVYMDNVGHITFGVYPGAVRTVDSGNKTYNDNTWHHIVASQSSTNGLALYIDGKRIGADASTTTAQDYPGFWRIGGDNLGGWPNQPSSNYLNASIDDVAVYPSALSLAKVQQHFTDSGRSLSGPAAPSDTYGHAVYADSPDLYWRLGETSGTTATDVSGNEADGVYSGGYTQGRSGAVSGTSDKAVQFDGASGTVASAGSVNNPTVYSEELWFNATTQHGGKLIGFGNTQSGTSSSYDRHVYMENSGQLTFGTYTGQLNTATSSQSYNDGQWHQMVATQGSDGMKLYVDGALVGTNPQTEAQSYSGYWRVGGDTVWSGDSNFFDGTIDEVAVYSKALSASDVQGHFQAGGGALPNQKPAAAFSATKADLKASVDASDSADSDGSIDSYSWNWGDATAAGSGKTTDHTYTDAGSYTITLTVTDNQGATDTVSSRRDGHGSGGEPEAGGGVLGDEGRLEGVGGRLGLGGQ